MKNLLFSLCVVAAVINTGCSTLEHNGGNYRDTTLSDANHAPSKLTPPDYKEGGANPVNDQNYLTAQADYHFTMGETLSFEGQSPRALYQGRAPVPRAQHLGVG